jgi:hypothetical protein
MIVPVTLTVLIGLRFQHSEWSDGCLVSMRTALNLATHGSASFNLGEPAVGPWSLLWVAPVATLCLLGLSPFTAVALLMFGLVAAGCGLCWKSYRVACAPHPSGGTWRSGLWLGGGLTALAIALAATWWSRDRPAAGAPRDDAVMRELPALNARRWSTDFGRPDGRRLAVISLQPGYDGLRLGPAQMVLPWRALADPRITGSDPSRPLEIAGAAATDGRAERNNFGKRWRVTTAAAGTVQLRLRFARGKIGLAEPLCSLGDPATGLLFMVRRETGNAVRFLVRSAGTARSSRMALSVDFERVYDWAIAWEPSGSNSADTGRIRLRLDGSLLGDWTLPVQRFRNDEVLIGWNTQGYEACLSRFGGTIAGTGAPPDASGSGSGDGPAQTDALPRLDAGTGPITALLQFNGPTLGVGLGLLETGVTGAGDIVSLLMVDPTHVRFSFDHWGVGGFTGPVVPVDPMHVYRCRIELGSLQPADPARPELATEVRVVLDGRVVLAGHSAFHPARPDQLHFMANALGSSGVGAPFDGTCVRVERGRRPFRASSSDRQ